MVSSLPLPVLWYFWSVGKLVLESQMNWSLRVTRTYKLSRIFCLEEIISALFCSCTVWPLNNLAALSPSLSAGSLLKYAPHSFRFDLESFSCIDLAVPVLLCFASFWHTSPTSHLVSLRNFFIRNVFYLDISIHFSQNEFRDWPEEAS